MVAQEILDLILQMRNGDVSSPVHLEKIKDFIFRNEPIEFVLPAFPAKSSNPEKTLGTQPDFGEVLALKRLDQLCKSISQIYKPGAHIVICSDGRVFSDLVQVSDHAVDEYGQGIERIIHHWGLKNLSTYNLDDGFNPTLSHDAMRAKLVEAYGDSVDRIREQLLGDPGFLQLFNGIHRFLFEDMSVLRRDLTRNKIRNLSKELTYSVIQRSQAWSNLVNEIFPRALRLSIHPQTPFSNKIGVRLLPSSNIWRTPWHSVALYDGTSYSLVPRKEAEGLGAKLMRAEGQYAYYAI